MSRYVVLVVFVPASHAERVRTALADSGAGCLGNYSACSFSTPGYGRFLPNTQAHPTIGMAGRSETVEEMRIEVLCPRECAAHAIRSMLAVHPYEEPAWHAYEALLLEDFDEYR